MDKRPEFSDKRHDSFNFYTVLVVPKIPLLETDLISA